MRLFVTFPGGQALLLLQVTSVWLSAGEPQQSNAVYGLPELTRDILERIKAATGHPIDTGRFSHPSTKNYEILEPLPFTKTSRYLKKSGNENLDKGRFSLNEKGDDSGRGKDRFFEIFERDKERNELLKHKYGDQAGKSHRYNEERYLKKNHHKSHGGGKGAKSRKGRKRGKFRVEKGFRDIYHKDEEKKSDFFWNNQHEEGKWIEYGFKNKKQEKSHDKGDEGKQEKDKTEESTYEKKEDKCSKCKS